MGLNEKFFASEVESDTSLKLHLDASDSNSYGGSGDIWYDLSGNGNNATRPSGSTGASWSSNGYFNFDGTNDRMQVPNFYGFPVQTWSMWVYCRANERTVILTTFGTSITEGAGKLELHTGLNPRYDIRSTSGTKVATSSTTNMSKFNWHMITGTSSGTSVQIHFNDGTEDSTSCIVNNVAGSAQEMVIGYDVRSGDKFLNGRISKIRVWDRVLTQTEIETLYSEGE